MEKKIVGLSEKVSDLEIENNVKKGRIAELEC
jgi:hypothetical protein